MMERKAWGKLAAWKKHKTKQTLLITGARQVGKTFLAQTFAKENYRRVVSFNLVEDQDARASFKNAKNGDDLMLRISVAASAPIIPGKTVVFIDEVQECPEIVTLSKFLVERQDCDFILSGSLLGVELENIRSNPVGYMTEVMMYPLDFEEFCWANGVDEEAFNLLREAVATKSPVPDFLHTRLSDLFHRYLLVGGMPDAIVTLLVSHDIDSVRTTQEDIVRYYGRDISKYAPKDRRLLIKNIYDLIPSELLRQNKRFRLSAVEDVKRYTQVQGELLWLTKANVALPVYNVAAPTAPLLLAEERRLFKLFLSDVGLLTSRYPKQASLGLLDGAPKMNLGGVYENFVAQELAAHGFDLRYYTGKKTGKIDFLIERKDGRILALEVKSGREYKTHTALINAMSVPEFDIAEAYVLAETNAETAGDIRYLPVYAASVFQNE
jgi:predicted AAA+ superfamily ATPase